MGPKNKIIASYSEDEFLYQKSYMLTWYNDTFFKEDILKEIVRCLRIAFIPIGVLLSLVFFFSYKSN